jgi:tetraacyldisaccharide 4'-kinase
MIQAPRFWTNDGWMIRLLRPVSWIYGGIADARMAGPPRYRAKVPVIAIGNFTAGGAGKTPTAIALTHIAIDLGFSPIVLMRGYGGTARRPVLVDGDHDTAREVGDEALMIAQAGVPVIASHDRAAGAEFAVACGSDLIILDDGFQSPALAKDLSIVVVDSVYGVGNGRVIPAGPLRASLDTQFAALDALVVVSNGTAGLAASDLADRARAAGRPVFAARIEPDEKATDFKDRRVVAFAGIGRPEKLAEGLRARGAVIEELVAFPDHHRFTPTEARALLARIDGSDRILVTTAKDMARLTGDPDPALSALANQAEVARVQLVFDDKAAVVDFLRERLGRLGASTKAASPSDNLPESIAL